MRIEVDEVKRDMILEVLHCRSVAARAGAAAGSAAAAAS